MAEVPDVKDWLIRLNRRLNRSGPPLSAAEVAQLRAQLARQAGVSRRMAVTGGAAAMVAGRGDGLRRPMNAPPAGAAVPGVQPGASSAVFARYVVIFGDADGWFVYSGTPGPGNPPIAWGASGTKDPFGNSLPYNSTLGITSTATFSAGDTLITPNGQFIYTATPASGKLGASIVPLGGVLDPFGDTTLEGFTSYSDTGDVVNVVNEYIGMGPLADATERGYWAYVGAGIYCLTSPQVTDLDTRLGVSLYSKGAGNSGNSFGQVVIGEAGSAFSGPTPVTDAQLELQAGTGGGDGLALVGSASQSAIITTDGNGYLEYEASVDSLTYRAGHHDYRATGVNVSGTSPGTVLSMELEATTGVGYHITGYALFHSTNGGAGTANWSWGGTADLSRQEGYNGELSPVAAIHLNNGTLGGANVSFNGGTGECLYVFDVHVTVSTAGTLTFAAAVSAAGDTWTVDVINARVEPF